MLDYVYTISNNNNKIGLLCLATKGNLCTTMLYALVRVRRTRRRDHFHLFDGRNIKCLTAVRTMRTTMDPSSIAVLTGRTAIIA